MNSFSISKKDALKWLVAVAIPLIIWLMPVTETFTVQIRLFLMITIFAIAAIVMNLLPNMLVAIILPTLYAATGLAPLGTAFSAYSGNFFWMVIGALFLGGIMNETGVLTRISYIIIRKLGGSFSGAVWAVFASTLIVSVVTFGMGWIVAVPVVLGVIKALKLERGREAGLICFAGITGAIDCAVILYSPSTCGILDSVIQEFIPGYTMNIFTSLIYCWPVLIFCVLVIALILWKYKRDLKKHPEQAGGAPVTKQYFTEQLAAMGPMSADEIKTMAVFCIILVMYILSAFLGWSSTYYFMLLPYLTFLPVVGCKEKAMTALKNLNFNGVFFASSCVGIGSVGTAVGFSSWLSSVATPLVTGTAPLITCVLIVIIICLGHFVMTPTAMYTALGSTFSQIAVTVGMSPVAAMILMRYAGNIIFLPHQTSGYLLLFGLGYWPMKDLVKDLGFKSVVFFVGFIAIIYPYWSLLGLL